MNTYQALKVLNIDSKSSQEEIKAAYRKLALEVHPDKKKDKNADNEFKKITEAYNYLKKNHNQIIDSDNQDSTQNKSTKKQYRAKTTMGCTRR